MILHLGTQIAQGHLVTLLGRVQNGEVPEKRQVSTLFPALVTLAAILEASAACAKHHEAVCAARDAWIGELGV